MRSKLVLVLLLFAGVATLFPAGDAAAIPGNCFTNPRSDYTFYEGQALCMGTGDGCTVCSEVGGRGAGSWDLCYFSVRTGDITCYTMY